MDFYQQFIAGLFARLGNNFPANHDRLRFGADKSAPLAERFLHRICPVTKRDVKNFRRSLDLYLPHLPALEKAYSLLANQLSRDLFLQILIYRILGKQKTILPLGGGIYEEQLRHFENKIKPNRSQPAAKLGRWTLQTYNLGKVGFPIKIVNTAKTLFSIFGLRQYCYNDSDRKVNITPKKGDTVIDAGGCWGDTALFMASLVGSKGRIYSFEFDPKNLAIFNKNRVLNPKISKRISIIEKPLYSESKVHFDAINKGPGSKLGAVNPKGSLFTITLDDWIKSENLTEVNFIKMDIEGAEFPALQGAQKTLREHRPSLAISIYHSIPDLFRIIQFLHELNLGYKFYLGHYTIHEEETVLFCKVTK